MSLAITQYPQANVYAEISKWQAVHHPIIFEVQRQDQQVQMKYKPSGYDVIVKVVGAVSPLAAVGDRIQYHASNGNVYTWNIVSISGSNIQTDGTITGTQYNGFINYLDSNANYFVSTEVYSVDLTNTYVLLGTLRHKAGLTGKIKITVNEWLKTLTDFKNLFSYDQINKALINEGARYQIRFREQYNGVEQGLISSAIAYWSNSAKQIGEIYGSNMGDYVPTPDATRVNHAKFLSVFDKPTYFVGFPFSLNFLYSETLTNLQITREEETFDLNGTSIATTSDNLIMSQRFFNNRLLINHPYTSDVKEVDVWLNSGAAVALTESAELEYDTGSYEEVPTPDSPPIKPVKPLK